MKSRSRILPLLAALASAGITTLSAAPALAVGQATGRITGKVIEQQTQAPVPGAVIDLSGGAGVRMKGSTDDNGLFELDAIPPGTYDLVLRYEGLKPVHRRVAVNADAATPVNIVWSAESAEEETLTVQEERHISNPDSPQTGQVYTSDRQNQLPLARAYQAIASQIPGVTSGGANPNVKGARFNNNRYLVNGLDLTDPVTNTAGANFQQDSLESMSVQTGGFEAKYNALGAIIAVQTKRGTNEFHGAASAYYAPKVLTDYDTFGPQLFDGAKGWDYSAKKPEQGSYELNLSARGPIVKDHLFFNAGIRYEKTDRGQPSGPPRYVQARPTTFTSLYITTGITFVPVDKHRFHVEVFGDPTTQDFETNQGAAANSTTPYSQAGRSSGGWRGTAEWAWLASKHVTAKVLVGFNQNKVNAGPQGLRSLSDVTLDSGPYNFNRPAHTNNDDGTVWFNTPSHLVQTRRRYQLDASITATGELGGRHEAELGLQSALLQQGFRTSFTGGSSGVDSIDGYGIAYTDRGGGPLDSALCDLDPYVNPAVGNGTFTGTGCFRRSFSPSYAASQSGNTFGVYLQDRYKPRPWLTILPGLRWDTGTVRASDSTASQTAFGFGPRLSVIADVTGDQKSVLQASYGRTTEMPTLGGVANYDSARRVFTTIQQYDSNTRRFVFQQTTGGADGTRLDFSHSPATADEILLSGRREVSQGVLARVDYTYRYYRRQYEGIEVNSVMDPTGTRTIGWQNGVPTRITQYGYASGSNAQYSGLDFLLETRLKNVEIQGGYTLSWSWGPTGSGAFDNQRFSDFYQAYQNVDTRHQLKSSTTVTVLPGLTVGLILNWRSGSALSKSYPTNETGYAIRRAPTGYDPGSYYNTGTSNPTQLGTYSDVRSWTSFRTPDVFTANMMVGYDLAPIVKQHITLNLNIFNVLALSSPTGVNTSEGSPNATQFGLASGRQSFRTFTMGARYDF